MESYTVITLTPKVIEQKMMTKANISQCKYHSFIPDENKTKIIPGFEIEFGYFDLIYANGYMIAS